MRDAIFAEGTYHAAYEPQRAIRTPRWKYVRRFGDRARPGAGEHRRQPQQGAVAARRVARATCSRREQLYDLVLDPNEACNRIDDPRLHETADELRVRLERWMARHRRPAAGRPVAPPPGALVNDPDGVSALEPPQVIA